MGIYPIKVVRYGLNTLPNTPVCLGTNTPVRFGTNSVPVPRHDSGFGTTSIPVPGTSVRVYSGYLPYQSGSVRPQYATEHSSMLGYELHTSTRHFGTLGKFGTTSTPVPDASVGFGNPTKNTPCTGIPTEHTLAEYTGDRG